MRLGALKYVLTGGTKPLLRHTVVCPSSNPFGPRCHGALLLGGLRSQGKTHLLSFGLLKMAAGMGSMMVFVVERNGSWFFGVF